jgi:hypothetical protein
VAGVTYTEGLRIAADDDTFDASVSGIARVRLVIHTTEPSYGNCNSPDFYRAGGQGFSGEALTLLVDANGSATTAGAWYSIPDAASRHRHLAIGSRRIAKTTS